MKIKLLKRITVAYGTYIDPSSILQVRQVQYRECGGYLAEGYQVIEDGPYIGTIIPKSSGLPLSPVTTYSEDEYRAIVADRDETKAKLDKALDDLAEHGRTIKELRERLGERAKRSPEEILKHDIVGYLRNNLTANIVGQVNCLQIAAVIAERARELLIEQSEHQ